MNGCSLKFKNGRVCTYYPLEGFDVCSHQALQYVAQRSGEEPEALLANLLELYGLDTTAD